MSATFTAAAKALNDNPELATKVMSAGTPAERAEILKSAGVAVPTHADVNSYHASLSDVSGAGNTTNIATGVNAAAGPAAASAAAMAAS
jgi:hypothetical protein